MNYERSQTGPLARIMFAFSVFIVILTLTLGDAEPGAPLATGLAMLAIVAVVYAFSRLTVKVDGTQVSASFTWGWPRREFPLSDITNIRQVRNKWWYGIGIRLAPNGAWIFSVWGLDAVELELRSGKKFRIGSEDSDGLFAALALTITPHP